ncbi:polysaccharide lyase family 7 protein, partial [Flavobacteriaceae bacterium]|nr:polysaccharide lyase family 7 protein [Flavobacteriaceae bacterium]
MNIYSLKSIFLLILSFSFLFAYSGSKKRDIGLSKLELDQAERELVNSQDSASAEMPAESTSSTTTPTLLPNIDLSNWKVTLPIGNPTSVRPPEILDYANNETLKPFF